MPIKVLHILEVEKEAFYFSNLADYTSRDDVEFSFANFEPESDFSRSMEDRGFEVFSLGKLRKSNFLGASARLLRLIKYVKPDIVHTHLFNPTIVGLNLARLLRLRSVVTRHHSDALHMLPSKLKRKFFLTLERQNNRIADRIIAPSKMVYECIVDWEGTPANKVSIIPYGQTRERFEIISDEQIHRKRVELGMDKQLSIVCVSRLFKRKGHEYLFEAFSGLVRKGVDAKLYLAGEGEHKPRLLELTNRLGISDRVKFLGWQSEVLKIIGASDIIVHPSLEDALSQSLVESLMMSKPIVATDISGAADTLGDGKYGRLVPPADAGALETALLEVIENLDLARESASKGKSYILDYMDAKKVADEYKKLYCGIIG